MRSRVSRVDRIKSLAFAQVERALELEKAGKTKESVQMYKKALENIEILLKAGGRTSGAVISETLRKKLVIMRERILKRISKSSNSRAKAPPVPGKFVKLIEGEILDKQEPLRWDDIAGLDDVKRLIKESIILPIVRPDLFQGLRTPSRGILFYGPPGTGKTLIARATAYESKATFFPMSSSSLTSRYLGESEKIIKALFYVARKKSPSIVFLDEIDSLLSRRGGKEESEASRRIKTEFLVQLDGATSPRSGDNVLVIAATNRPWDLDEAALRRFEKRIYIGLPDMAARRALLKLLFKDTSNTILKSRWDLNRAAKELSGYSGADIASVCKEASMYPLREHKGDLMSITPDKIRPVTLDDLLKAKKVIKPSTSKNTLAQFRKWKKEYGF